MTEQTAERKNLGIITGVILIVVWTCLVIRIETSMIAIHQNVYENPLLFWINIGPVPLFIAAGMYCFTKKGLTDEKRQQEFAGIKGMFAGYVIWIAALLLEPPPGNDTLYPELGGFLLMLVLALAFQGKFRLRDG